MERWRGKVAVVTGASAGIGANLCERLVEEGLQVVGLARRVERIQDLASLLNGKPGKLHPVKCDVSKQEEVESTFQWIKDNIGTVQILVNNAGLIKVGTLLEGDPNDWKTILETNVLGLTMCAKEAYKQLKETGLQGHIVNINSVAGHFIQCGTPPFLNMYSPSKHAVTCLTEIMRREMLQNQSKNIKITSVSPGLVKTDIAVAAGIDVSTHPLSEAVALNSEDISDTIIYVLSTPSHVEIPELTIRPVGELVYN